MASWSSAIYRAALPSLSPLSRAVAATPGAMRTRAARRAERPPPLEELSARLAAAAAAERHLPVSDKHASCLVPLFEDGGGVVNANPQEQRHAHVPPSFVPRLNPSEVDAAFHMPLAAFLEGDCHLHWDVSGGRGSGIRYRIHSFDHRRGPDHFIVWGLTASMLIRVAELGFGRPPAFEVNGKGCTCPSQLAWDGSRVSVLGEGVYNATPAAAAAASAATATAAAAAAAPAAGAAAAAAAAAAATDAAAAAPPGGARAARRAAAAARVEEEGGDELSAAMG
ncbi:hypothetical protein Rsub_05554 [Raphidocelis subcapitata]|uniref:Uncharacterized protein n=1 Tax=Raphidocelis subcapitata TaxID=307507 RepID=A0A2V0P0A6_9CHLO|nr:hypothetical protein Rsub_05554 [Raphidocelis subcapitata]|eukprot:GBF92352.1 hypothetical protein Rsub_05554 [Raphidocelis subcapitata]